MVPSAFISAIKRGTPHWVWGWLGQWSWAIRSLKATKYNNHKWWVRTMQKWGCKGPTGGCRLCEGVLWCPNTTFRMFCERFWLTRFGRCGCWSHGGFWGISAFIGFVCKRGALCRTSFSLLKKMQLNAEHCQLLTKTQSAISGLTKNSPPTNTQPTPLTTFTIHSNKLTHHSAL
jgi:hypothetical protein